MFMRTQLELSRMTTVELLTHLTNCNEMKERLLDEGTQLVEQERAYLTMLINYTLGRVQGGLAVTLAHYNHGVPEVEVQQ